jgi:DNA-binding LacI/PurR family transcriptional regulator
MPTIKDIAKELNLSIATVSRALSADKTLRQRVKPGTLKRIDEAASQLEYRRNREAEFMKRRRSPVIGVFLPDFADSLMADLMFGMSKAATNQSFPVRFYPGMNVDDYRNFIRENIAGQSVGIITYPLADHRAEEAESDLKHYHQKGGHVLMLNTASSFKNIPVLGIDEFEGGSLAASVLARHVVPHIVIQGNSCYPLSERLRGFENYFTEKNIGKTTERYDWGDDAGDFLCSVIKRHGSFGFFATSDRVAMQLFRLLPQLGLEPGKDVPVVGFDDLNTSAFSRPALTTVRQPFRELGELAIEMLTGMFYNRPPLPRTLMKPELIRRESA